MHRTYAGASVLVATKPAELTPALRLLEVPAPGDIPVRRCNLVSLPMSALWC
jgi:hypothetical protein